MEYSQYVFNKLCKVARGSGDGIFGGEGLVEENTADIPTSVEYYL